MLPSRQTDNNKHATCCRRQQWPADFEQQKAQKRILRRPSWGRRVGGVDVNNAANGFAALSWHAGRRRQKKKKIEIKIQNKNKNKK